MVLHILKKDLRLLWRLILVVAALQFVTAAMFYNIDHLPHGNNPYGLLLQLMLFISMLARAILIILCIQQDPVPGVSQDWLSRPIHRRDMVGAKLLFVLVFVQLPVFFADLLQNLASGFSFSQSFSAAALRSLYFLMMLTLPFVAFGSLTNNLGQAVAAGVVAFLLIAGGQMVSVGFNEGRHILMVNPTDLTGLEWFQDAFQLLFIIAASAAILVLQYRYRKTLLSSTILAVAAILYLAVPYLPWNTAYAMQKILSKNSSTTNALQIQFDPSRPAFNKSNGIASSVLHGTYGDSPESDVMVYLPMNVSGMPKNSLLKTDRAVVTLVTQDGTPVNLGVSGDFRKYPQGNSSQAYYPVAVSVDLFKRYKDQKVSLEINDWVTLLQATDTSHLAPLNGSGSINSLGTCKTKINGTETAVDLHCNKPGIGANCISFTLVDPVKNQQNDTNIRCAPNYATISIFSTKLFPDTVNRIGLSIPFRDPGNPAAYNVKESDLPESQLQISIYQPVDHLQRTIAVPNIRLADWLPVD